LRKKEKKVVTLYSDGSSLGNPGAGGWGTILEYKGKERELSGGVSDTTNNRMELTAVIRGLQELKEPCSVEVVTDSSYVANAINSWLSGWVAKDFKKVKNIDLWREYLEAAKEHKVKATWVRGHSGHPQNERCDKLAVDAAKKIKESK
jgi:ribonuclease HI